jgi:ABC-type phosphate/phosphonate transport system permease subunit
VSDTHFSAESALGRPPVVTGYHGARTGAMLLVTTPGGCMKLLRTLLVFIAATVLAALGQQVLGIWGMVLGSIAGIFVGYWAARRLMP